ncbi:pentatricopeptide repeat-containing protein At2g13600 [Cryptomeria japonica]|uniref:pentatricopeptide repeat-containing protein At2g13600 n=1 Tax=Cryptomeria japonica TaxID=3369 RepID=UPI0027DA8E18|nr:pentatricopeptide repeat-containing protein At2g13600 [Cryptomeria japonica]
MRVPLKNNQHKFLLYTGEFLGNHDSAGMLCKKINFKYSSSAYAFLLQECLDKNDLAEGKRIQAHIIQSGFEFRGNKLLTLYAKLGNLEDARRTLNEMSKRNEVSWNVMVTAYARRGCNKAALSLFCEMKMMGFEPNQITYASVLPACANLGDLELGKELHHEIIRRGFQFDVFVGNALVDMYAKCGSLEDARDVFDKMTQRDLVSWNAMVSGYARNGHVDEALKLFEEMPRRNVNSWTSMISGFANHGCSEQALKMFYLMNQTGIESSHFTISSVLSACADLAALDQGEQIHEEVIRKGSGVNVFVGNALLDMYAKCGCIENARNVFDRMLQRDVVSWNAIIVGYAMHGYGKESLQLFEEMQHSGKKPDHVTFIGVLNACCHAGLVDKGLRYFHCMSQEYHMEPEIEHYGSMLDLLGRAGHLNMAQDFINKMPIEPDVAVWGALLGACRIHRNLEMGEYAARQLLELNPKMVTPYIMLSMIYMEAGRWEEIEKVQEVVKHGSIKKKPGCSWIVVNNQVNAFVAGDKSHLQTEIIYAKFGKLSVEMWAAMGLKRLLNDPNEEAEVNCYKRKTIVT